MITSGERFIDVELNKAALRSENTGDYVLKKPDTKSFTEDLRSHQRPHSDSYGPLRRSENMNNAREYSF